MSDKRQVAELLVDLHRIGCAKGYAAGLAAAREAVAALGRVDRSEQYGDEISREQALAAIDGLLDSETALHVSPIATTEQDLNMEGK